MLTSWDDGIEYAYGEVLEHANRSWCTHSSMQLVSGACAKQKKIRSTHPTDGQVGETTVKLGIFGVLSRVQQRGTGKRQNKKGIKLTTVIWFGACGHAFCKAYSQPSPEGLTLLTARVWFECSFDLCSRWISYLFGALLDVSLGGFTTIKLWPLLFSRAFTSHTRM